MKFKPLPSQNRLKELFNYDPATGIFTRREDRKRWKASTPCGAIGKAGYVAILVDAKLYQAHRLAWVYMTGAQPTYGVDHINGARSDNRWSNLREAGQSENSANKIKHRKKTAAKGVHPYGTRGRYRARIEKAGTKIDLGTFASEAEAKAAYDAAAKVLHGDFFRS